MSVTLAQASTIVDVALKKARDSNLAPLTVAVLDPGGHLVAFKREDKSGILRFDIAFGKAWGALGMGFGSRTLASRAAKTPQFFTMLAAASGGRMVTNPGGVLIKDASGTIVGACGISGDTSDKDEMCAVAGIEAAGLKADPGADSIFLSSPACGGGGEQSSPVGASIGSHRASQPPPPRFAWSPSPASRGRKTQQGDLQ